MSAREDARATVVQYLRDNDLEFEEVSENVFSFSLPGEKKLQTAVRLDVGPHALGVHAFVCRRPDENTEKVYRWLLERNLRMYADRKSTRLNSSHVSESRMPSSA